MTRLTIFRPREPSDALALLRTARIDSSVDFRSPNPALISRQSIGCPLRVAGLRSPA